jgi:nitrogen fixation NifU-like protein
MSEYGQLYQELILDHNKKPRNFRRITEAHIEVDGHNPLCGDKITLYLRLDDGHIADVSFQGSGCAISQASASLMTERIMGLDTDTAQALYDKFHDLVMGVDVDADADPELGKLEAFAGVAEFPARVKCASLAWHTLKSALEGKGESVSTE